MEKILNLTQHPSTPEQAAQGVVEPTNKDEIKQLITFVGIPSRELIRQRASQVAKLAGVTGIKKAMIGGAPYFMGSLENALREEGIEPVYAFSERVAIETLNADGTVTKSQVFKHIGFVEV